MTSPVARFTVNDLEPGIHYQAALFSYNTKGRSEPVVLQASTLRLPEKHHTAEKGTGFRARAVTEYQVECISGNILWKYCKFL